MVRIKAVRTKNNRNLKQAQIHILEKDERGLPEQISLEKGYLAHTSGDRNNEQTKNIFPKFYPRKSSKGVYLGHSFDLEG